MPDTNTGKAASEVDALKLLTWLDGELHEDLGAEIDATMTKVYDSSRPEPGPVGAYVTVEFTDSETGRSLGAFQVVARRVDGDVATGAEQ